MISLRRRASLDDACVVLPEITLVLGVSRVRILRPIGVRLDPVEGKWTYLSAESRIQIGVLDPTVGVEEEIALPSWW